MLSPTDRRRDAHDECRRWIAAGARLAVLVDAERRTATTFSEVMRPHYNAPEKPSACQQRMRIARRRTLTFGDGIPDLAIAPTELFA